MKLATTAMLVVAVAVTSAPVSAQDSFEQVHVMPFGEPSTVAVTGDLGIYGITNGIMVIDISDPASPVKLSRLSLPGSAEGITVDGDRVFVAAGEAGVATVDLTSPANPVLIRVDDTPGEACAVGVAGEWIFVADGSGGFRSISLQPGESAFGVVNVPGARAVAVGGHLAVVVGSPDVWLIDISEPEDMVVLATIPISAVAVAMDGDRAFIGSYANELLIFDLALPAVPNQVGSHTLAGILKDMEYSNGLVWVSNYEYQVFSGLRVIDVADPANPVEIGSLELEGYSYDIHVSGHTALFGDRYHSPVVDVADPSHPVLTGTVPTSMPAINLWTIGDLVLVGLGWDSWSARYFGIDIIDFSDPTAPVDLATIALPDRIVAVSFDESRLVVADRQGQVFIYDIYAPSLPVLLGSFGLAGWVGGVAISGDFLYATDDFGFRVMDISDPSLPSEAGFFVPSWWGVSTLRVVGNHVYGNYEVSVFEGWGGGIWVADVSDPSGPFEIGYKGGGYPAEFVLNRDRAYLLGTGGSIGVNHGDVVAYDVSSSGDPVELDSTYLMRCAGCGQATAMTLIYDHVIASYDHEIFVLKRDDLSDRTSLDLGHTLIESMATVRNHLLVADYDYGLMVFIDPEVFVDGFETGDTTAWAQ